MRLHRIHPTLAILDSFFYQFISFFGYYIAGMLELRIPLRQQYTRNRAARMCITFSCVTYNCGMTTSAPTNSLHHRHHRTCRHRHPSPILLLPLPAPLPWRLLRLQLHHLRCRRRHHQCQLLQAPF